MKKSDTYSNINRNTNTVNDPRQKDARVHPVSPDIHVRHIWHQDRGRNGVKITELGSKDKNIENENLKFNQTLNFCKYDRFVVESPNKNVSSKARERKLIEIPNRRRNEVSHKRLDFQTEEMYVGDLLQTGFHDSFNNVLKEDNIRSYPINCFTIKNVSTEESNCSSENSGIEFINCNDFSYNANQYECNEDDTSCEQQSLFYNADIDTKKRSTWIYSFNNRHHFKENVYSSSECSSSTSTENCEMPVIDTTVNRVPTPVPGLYVPLLNLSLPPTLPTVTEVTEPLQPANEILEYEDNVMKHVNGWFIDSSPKTEETRNNYDDKSTIGNVIDWMCLSPRNKRKRYRVAIHKSFQTQDNLLMARKVNSIGKNNSHGTVNYNKNGIKGEIQSIPNIPANNLIVDQINLIKEITIEDVGEIEGRGDHDINQTLKKPNIQISSKAETRVVTGPIELLDCNNWIIEKELPSLKNEENIKDLSRKLRAKNIILLKPVQWSQYFPTTDSAPSLHLSLDTAIEEEMTCFKRILRCLKCFK